MTRFPTYIETGKRLVFANAIDWPGWSRGGRSAETALANLHAYGPRYAAVLEAAGIPFTPPDAQAQFVIAEQFAGNRNTDYGMPAVPPAADAAPVDAAEHARLVAIVHACWQAFDRALEMAQGGSLRALPRGGGRDQSGMLAHIISGEERYLARLAWPFAADPAADLLAERERARAAVLAALARACTSELPARGAHGRVLWRPRYFVRRLAWHTLDHAWELEDRLLQSGG